MKLRLPASVKMILDILNVNAYEAYVVGGCVRDSILFRNPDDWDITTSATPEQVKALFPRTVDTGLQHGTVTVIHNKKGYEVTTYRVDGEYEDGRHPKEVLFTASLEEDLKRRDFTINAMAYHPEQGLVDLFGGMDDLQKKVIRCVGDPMERFSEDALRILRAVRFSAQLGFGIDRETIAGILRLAPTLEKISAERIQTELVKLLVSKRPEYIKVAYQTGITKVVLPELDAIMNVEQHTPYHCYTVGEHTISSMQGVGNDKVLRLAMLMHDFGKAAAKTTDENGIDHFKGHAAVSTEIAHSVLRRLKFDNYTIRKITTLVRYHDYRMEGEEKAVRRAMNKIGEELFPLLLKVQNADAMAKSPAYLQESLERIFRVRSCYERIMEEKQCFSLKDLQLSGKDLLELGCEKGPKIGEILNAALELVLDDPQWNDHEKLLEFARKNLATMEKQD